jgi:hypothetical protein
MNDWKDIKIEGISRIERVAAKFQVWSVPKFPSTKMIVKITEDVSGMYHGSTNLGVRKKESKEVLWAQASGDNIADVLSLTICEVLLYIEENNADKRSDDDFVWQDPILF